MDIRVTEHKAMAHPCDICACDPVAVDLRVDGRGRASAYQVENIATARRPHLIMNQRLLSPGRTNPIFHPGKIDHCMTAYPLFPALCADQRAPHKPTAPGTSWPRVRFRPLAAEPFTTGGCAIID